MQRVWSRATFDSTPDAIVRHQLEGAVEVLERAREDYRSLAAVLGSAHWAPPLVRSPTIIQRLQKSESAVVESLRSAQRRRERRPTEAAPNIPVADEVKALRETISAHVKALLKTSEDRGLTEMLRELQSRANESMTEQTPPWWKPGHQTVEISARATPSEWLAELAQKVADSRESASSKDARVGFRMETHGDRFTIRFQNHLRGNGGFVDTTSLEGSVALHGEGTVCRCVVKATGYRWLAVLLISALAAANLRMHGGWEGFGAGLSMIGVLALALRYSRRGDKYLVDLLRSLSAERVVRLSKKVEHTALPTESEQPSATGQAAINVNSLLNAPVDGSGPADPRPLTVPSGATRLRLPG
jgi:hypothetical protein